MATNTQASALRMGSYGSLLQGAGQVANMGYNYGVFNAGSGSSMQPLVRRATAV
jgi:hypothetical protein